MDKAILMPSDKELEKKIIGYLITYPENARDFFLELSSDYFRNNDYKHIIKRLHKMYTQGKEVDVINLDAELQNDISYRRVGGRRFIYESTDEIRFDSLAGAFDVIKRLKDLHLRREIIREAQKIEYYCLNSEDLDEEITNTFDNLSKILSKKENKTKEMADNIKLLEESIAQNKEKELIGYSFGNTWLDEHTGGLRKGKTYRIGGLSGSGKTSFIYGVIHSLLKQKAKVLFLTLENSIETTLVKFLSCIQKVNPKDIENGRVEADIDYLHKVGDKLKIIDNLFSLNEIKREILKVGPDVVILDYIGLVEIPGFTEETKYNKYADSIREFVQKHSFFAYMDISNLGKVDNEYTIREFRAFNGSAKLRNNTDFGMHIFPYSKFEKYKARVMKNGTLEQKKNLYGKKVQTFFISKNRFGDDGLEKEYFIDFNKGTSFLLPTEKDLEIYRKL